MDGATSKMDGRVRILYHMGHTHSEGHTWSIGRRQDTTQLLAGKLPIIGVLHGCSQLICITPSALPIALLSSDKQPR